MTRTGRPTTYSEEMVELILQRVSTHACGLQKLCRMYDDMPDDTTIYLWRYKYPEFSRRFLETRKLCSHVSVESIANLTDELEEYIYHDDKGNKDINTGIVSKFNLQIRARIMLASKINPEQYSVAARNEAQAEEIKTKEELLRIKDLIESRKKDC